MIYHRYDCLDEMFQSLYINESKGKIKNFQVLVSRELI